MRCFLELSYNGTAYQGWQLQANSKPTLQGTIQYVLSTILGTSIEVVGCGRTDAGVHASQYYLHFDVLNCDLPPNFEARLNRFLPKDIAIKRLITNLPEQAHARFDATYRAYTYYVHFQKNPFLYPQSFYYFYPLDHNKMQTAAAMLLNYNDFELFCKTGGNNKTTLCNLFASQWFFDEQQQTARYYIAANRFLRGMVRLITGALLMVGRGKLSLLDLEKALQKQKKLDITISAPAHALYLSEVKYAYISN